MRRQALRLLLALLPATAHAEPSTPVALSLFHPVSTNQAPVRVNLGLGLFYSEVGAVRGVDVTLIASRTRGDVHGLHGAGVWSRIDGNFTGGMLVPGVSWVKGRSTGVVLALAGTVHGGDTKGVFLTGALDVIGGSMSGVMLTGAANVVDENASGVVLSAFGNIVGRDFRGFALASGYNYVGGRAIGVQFGGVNFAEQALGWQFGLANFARDNRGLQLGFYNHAEHQGGVPVGMVNVASNGIVEGVAYTSNLAPIHAGVRTEVHHISSMLTLGGWDQVGDVEDSAILTWNLGAGVHVTKAIELIADFGLAHYMPKHTSDPDDNDRLHPATQARGLVRVSLGHRIRVIAGGGSSRVYEAYEDNPASEFHSLWLAGFSWQ